MGAEVGCVTVIDVGAAIVGIDVLVGEVRRGVVAGGALLIAVSIDNSGKAGDCAGNRSTDSEYAVTSMINTTVSRRTRQALQIPIIFGMNRSIDIQSGLANGDYHSARQAHTNLNASPTANIRVSARQTTDSHCRTRRSPSP